MTPLTQARDKLVSDLQSLRSNDSAFMAEMSLMPSVRECDEVAKDMDAYARVIGRFAKAIAEELDAQGCPGIDAGEIEERVKEPFEIMAAGASKRGDEIHTENSRLQPAMEAW